MVATWGELVSGEKTFRLHRKQSEIMRSKARFNLACAGTGGGKTVLGPIWIMREIQRVAASRDLRHEPIKGMILAPTYPILSRESMPTFVRTLEGTDMEGTWFESKNCYVLPNGMGRIYTMGADRPGGIEGGQFDFAWLDEGGQLKYDAWVAVQGRLGRRMGPCLITTTPYTQNWLFHRFFQYWKDGDPNYNVVQWDSIENPVYPREEFDRVAKTMSVQRFAMRYRGQFVRLAGLVYPDLPSCRREFTELPSGVLYGGLDWGFYPDPFACLAAVRDASDHLWVFYERYVRSTLVSEHARKVPKGVCYFADASEPESIAAFKQVGHVVQANQISSRKLGWNQVNERIYSGTLHIASCCSAVFHEAEDYRWPEEDDEFVAEEPVGVHHALDALRYLVVNVDRAKLLEAA